MSEKKRKEGTFGKSVRNLILQLKIIRIHLFSVSFLTLVVAVLSLTVCHIGPVEFVNIWWDGLSNQFTLAFQMGLMVVVCATCALEAHKVSSYLMALQVLYTHVWQP